MDPSLYVEPYVEGDKLKLNISTNVIRFNNILTVTVDGVVKKFTIDESSEFEVIFENLGVGEHEAIIEFDGGDYYLSQLLNIPFTINKTEEPHQNDTLENNDTFNESENTTGIDDNGTGNSTGFGDYDGNGNSTDLTGDGDVDYSSKIKKAKRTHHIAKNKNLIILKEIISDFGNIPSSESKDEGKSYELSKSSSKSINNTPNLNILLTISIVILILCSAVYLKSGRKGDEY